jgi:hypothetical protein
VALASGARRVRTLDAALDPLLSGRNVEVWNPTDAHERQAIDLPRPPHDRSGVLVEPRGYLLDGLKFIEGLVWHWRRPFVVDSLCLPFHYVCHTQQVAYLVSVVALSCSPRYASTNPGMLKGEPLRARHIVLSSSSPPSSSSGLHRSIFPPAPCLKWS